MKTFKQMSRWFALLFLFLICQLASATNSPTSMLQNVANQMLAYLQQHQAELNSHPQLIAGVVERVLVPHINTDRMAGLVVGRQVWQTATPAQRQAFIGEFKKLVISTYANALASYNNDRVQFYPLRGGFAGQRMVTVNSVIIRQNGQRIVISYNLVMNGSHWQVYDFSIEGVSMVQSYQSQFADVLAHGGMPALIKKLELYNQGQS
jgi:phospholipid transport system substrate-binding protein